MTIGGLVLPPRGNPARRIDPHSIEGGAGDPSTPARKLLRDDRSLRARGRRVCSWCQRRRGTGARSRQPARRGLARLRRAGGEVRGGRQRELPGRRGRAADRRRPDQGVGFSADGKIAYSAGDSSNANGRACGGASPITISRSTEGGVNWQPPVTARLDTSTTVLNDKESITADPVKPNDAYAVW